MKIGQSEICCCYNTTSVISDHLLQHCLLQDTLQKILWPKDLSLTKNLCGDPAAQRRTAASVGGDGVFVYRIFGDQERRRRMLTQQRKLLL